MHVSYGWAGPRAAIMMVVSCTPTFVYSAEPVMPPTAAAILAQMDKEIAAAKTKAVISLEKVVKETTKKGDLSGALAVKEAADRLKAETATGPASVPGGINASAVVGRWHWRDYTYDFTPDASVKHSGGGAGRWQLEGKNVEVTWDNGYKYRLSVTLDGLVGIQIDASGKESNIRLSREK